METKLLLSFLFLLMASSSLLTVQAQKENKVVQEMKMSLQKRVASDSDTGSYIVVNDIQEWNPRKAAIIICDMWNEHWRKGATERVTEPVRGINNLEKDKVIYTSMGALGLMENRCLP